MSLLSAFRGLLPHSDVLPFIVTPFPEGDTNTAALGNRLNPYHVSQLDLTPSDEAYPSLEPYFWRDDQNRQALHLTLIDDLTSRRMLETGWPANQ
jgi:hypothetical protein